MVAASLVSVAAAAALWLHDVEVETLLALIHEKALLLNDSCRPNLLLNITTYFSRVVTKKIITN